MPLKTFEKKQKVSQVKSQPDFYTNLNLPTCNYSSKLLIVENLILFYMS